MGEVQRLLRRCLGRFGLQGSDWELSDPSDHPTPYQQPRAMDRGIEQASGFEL
jgi:hypothetical protein